MKNLGRHGRFGNQIFQYMFLHVYAKRHNLDVQIPPWCGQHLWGTTDPPVTANLPTYHERNANGGMSEQFPPINDEAVNRDWAGYGQFHMSWYRDEQDFIRSLFTPTAASLARVSSPLATLKSLGNTLVGMHIRRGDYGRLLYHRTPIHWYHQLLHQIWPSLNNPVLFVASQNPGLVNEFVSYDPVTSAELGVTPLVDPQRGYCDLAENIQNKTRSIDPWPDWYLLSQCDVIIMPVTSYSYSASLMNPSLKAAYRSSVVEMGFESIDVWDTTPMVKQRAENYRHVPGLVLDHNPPHYWRCPGCNGMQVLNTGKPCRQCNGIGTVPAPPSQWANKWKGIKI